MKKRVVIADRVGTVRFLNIFAVVFVLTCLIPSTDSQVNLSSSSISIDYNTPMIAAKGDINFGYMTSVHLSSDNKRSCDILRGTACTECLESLKFALRDLNRRTDLLPNITVGFVAVDDCGTPVRGLEVSMYFIKPNIVDNAIIDDDVTSVIANANNSRSQNVKQVVAVIGPLSSTAAQLSASFLSVFQIPQLAVYATSDLLSDKTIYEYFMRMVSPDTFRIRTVLDICQHFGWTYVSLVYSEGSYGENAASKINYFLQDSSSNYSICLATSQKLYADAKTADINRVVSTLLKFDNVNVVMFFLSGVHRYTFLTAVRQLAGIGRFLFLTGDLFTNYLSTPVTDMVEGAIYIDQQSAEMLDFVQYMATLDPADADGDVWLSSYWEQTKKCSLKDLLNLTGNGCKEPISLTPNVCPYSWPTTSRIYDAVQVLGDAIHRLVNDRCPQAFHNKMMLMDCISGPVLLNYLYKTNLTGRTGSIQFNTDGSIQNDFLIYQFQKAESGSYFSVSLGQASPWNKSISVNNTKVSWSFLNGRNMTDDSLLLTSVCSLPCKTSEYIIHGDVPCCWTCRTCRDNEIISRNQTACQLCPTFLWPDDSKTSCNPIALTYLHLSHPVSVCLLVMAALGGVFSLAAMAIYRVEREHKLIIATNIPLSVIMLVGTFVVSAAVVTFVLQPDLTGLCVIRSFGFHWGINLVHAPLSAKNILAYKLFTAGPQKMNGLNSSRVQNLLTIAFISVQVS
jgi:hypothetical protein